MSEGLICPRCTVKLANIGELEVHVRSCGSAVSQKAQSSHVKSQQRVWQDACSQVHAGVISYEDYARVLGPKLYANRHWKCVTGDRKSKVSVRPEPNERSPKVRILVEGEILFEIDNDYRDHRTWIQFFDIPSNSLAWVANTNRTGQTVRVVEIQHPKPKGFVHPAKAAGATPKFRKIEKRVSKEEADQLEALKNVTHTAPLYQPDLNESSSDDEDLMNLQNKAMERLRRRRENSFVGPKPSVKLTVAQAVAQPMAELPKLTEGNDASEGSDGEDKTNSVGDGDDSDNANTGVPSRSRKLSEKQLAALPAHLRNIDNLAALVSSSPSSNVSAERGRSSSTMSHHSVGSSGGDSEAGVNMVDQRVVTLRDETIAELRAEISTLKQKLVHANASENESFIRAEAAKSRALKLMNELQDLKQEFDNVKEASAKQLAEANQAAERAEQDLAALTVKSTKMEKYALQKTSDHSTLQKKFDVVKTEYTKTKQAQVLLVREVRKLRGEVAQCKKKLLAAAVSPAENRSSATPADSPREFDMEDLDSDDDEEEEDQDKVVVGDGKPSLQAVEAPHTKSESSSPTPQARKDVAGLPSGSAASSPTASPGASGMRKEPTTIVKTGPLPPVRVDVGHERPSWANVDEPSSGGNSPQAGSTSSIDRKQGTNADKNVAKFLDFFKKPVGSPKPGSPRRASVFGPPQDPHSIGNKMKSFFEDTAKKARDAAMTVRAESQATVIKMRDSMAKHKSKFVTFETGQIGILFQDEVDENGNVFVFIKDFLRRNDGEWFQAEESGKLLPGDIIAKIGPLGVEGMGRESVEAHLDMCERPVTVEFHIPSKRKDEGESSL